MTDSKTDNAMMVYLVMGEHGEYSDHSLWVESVHATPEGADARIAELKALQERARATYAANPNPLDRARAEGKEAMEAYYRKPFPEQSALFKAWIEGGGQAEFAIASDLGVHPHAEYHRDDRELKQ